MAVTDPPHWQFILARPTGEMVGQMDAARTRRLSFALDGAASVGFTMPGDHPQTQLITELEVDLVIVRDGQAIFRGRLGASGDTLSANVHTSTFTAVDYRGLLDRRIFWSGSTLTFRQVDQGDIAWQMIADSQAWPGGNMGISRGEWALTGVLRDRDYSPGKKIGEAIAQLGNVIGGFDWDIDPARRFNVYYPTRGRTTGIVLAFGKELTGLDRSFNSSSYANAIRFNGNEDRTVAVELQSDRMGPAGRFEASIGNPDLLLQDSVAERARFELAEADRMVAGYHVTLTPGWWNPGELWLGDVAGLVVRSGRLELAVPQRVVAVEIDLSDDGGETVRVSLGEDQASATARLGDYQSRIEVLERGQPRGHPDVAVGGGYDFFGPSPPPGFVWRDGRQLEVILYPELFEVLGWVWTPVGEQGGAWFRIPDERERMSLLAGGGRQMGQTGGAETVALSAAETGMHEHGADFPAHTHTWAPGAASAPDFPAHAHSWSPGAASEYDYPGHQHVGATDTRLGVHSHFIGMSGTGYEGGPGFPVWLQGGGVDTGGVDQSHAHLVSTYGPEQSHVHGLITPTAGPTSSHAHGLITPTAGPTAGHGHGLNSGGGAHQNMPPWVAIGKIIRILPPWRTPQN